METLNATRIRIGTEADLPALLEMGERFRQETAYRDRLVADPGHPAWLARYVMDTGRILVATDGDTLVGMLWLLVVDHPALNKRLAGAVVWWVDAGARHQGVGRDLLAAGEAWAREVGATALQVMAYHNAPVERLYGALGYEPKEIVFEKDLTS